MTTRAFGITPYTVAASLAFVVITSFAARAQQADHAVLASSVASAPEAGSAGGLHRGWLQQHASALSLRVIELPDESQPGGARSSRRHHALSWRNDTLSRSLDEMGMFNADCRNRLRLPSRLRQSPEGGTALQVQLQVAVSCSF